nr:WYL domain-containing protein [Cellulosimicrobium sp. MM]
MTETSRRTLLLLALLQARPDRTGPELAARLGVDARTVRRDVDRLRELGYHVVATRGRVGGYRLDAGAELPPLLLDDEQVVALTVALHTITASGVGDDLAEARPALTTSAGAARPARHRVDAVTHDRRPHRAPRGRPRRPARRERGGAPPGGAALRLRAVAPGTPPDAPPGTALPDDPRTALPPRRAEVHHVVVRGGRWYAVAWDLDRDDWRTFRLDRMTPRTPTGPRFAAREVPGGDVAAFVAARFVGALPSTDPGAGPQTLRDAGSAAPRGSGATRAPGTPAPGWPCEGWVELAAPARVVAPFVEDGAVEAAGPERCRVRLGSWSWVALAARVAAFDADVLAAGPAELVAACGAVARRLGAVAAS